MDTSVQRLLSDKLYDKRKAGALELETSIRNALADDNSTRISKILHQLVHDYAYAVHQPHARNGGLIGLAAAAIALGSSVSPYLSLIVPPVLACFSDQDARVRYYACESMYNIAKVAKGEILVYFNDVFDALCKLAADTELSVKNGAELLDRLVKDIVSESAATYASIVIPYDAPPKADEVGVGGGDGKEEEQETAFSLPRFIPLLKERIHVLNPFTRTFLVSWITLLDSIPDLELVAYLPSFLAGLLKFLSDPNQDVHTTTKVALDRFLAEIRKIAAVKKDIAENKKTRTALKNASVESLGIAEDRAHDERGDLDAESTDPQREPSPPPRLETLNNIIQDAAATGGESSSTPAEDGEQDEDEEDMADVGIDEQDFEDEWIPGQDVNVNYQEILDILLAFLASASSSSSSQEIIEMTTLKWIDSFLEICPDDVLAFTPRLLAQVLPALSSDVERVKSAAGRVNESLMGLVIALPEEAPRPGNGNAQPVGIAVNSSSRTQREINGVEKPLPLPAGLKPLSMRRPQSPEPVNSPVRTPDVKAPNLQGQDSEDSTNRDRVHAELDYEAAVNALTKQFLHEHEGTRVAALAWLIMLHRKSPRRILAIQDATFPALLQTLSDPAEAVVTRDLLLLSQISRSSDDSYFSSFMVNLLKLFSNDRRLLETRGNLIIRQLCLSLSAEKIYRTMADCLERDEYGEDLEFAAIMVQNLNNNLITAPELQDLRKRLRNLDTRDGQTFFTVLFRAWCVNAVATFSLCLLAQAYEQAYNLLQIFADLEMTVTMLIQIDKLVQLLESPVFTYLRMQLLEPERFPHLYKCLYGLLMLLPQSSAFAALKNRLGSVSAIGYLHIAPRGVPAGGTGATPSSVSTFERQNRLKSREDGTIRWTELLEKFKSTQEKVRRHQQRQLLGDAGLLEDEDDDFDVHSSAKRGGSIHEFALHAPSNGSVQARPGSALSFGSVPSVSNASMRSGEVKGKEFGHASAQQMQVQAASKHRSGFSQLGRLASGRKKDKKDK